ncbi:hypothetical protein EV360DRAFT_80852 [Lentinula raphanica]|nr:hypothetical protein EV360DRAFT_80852 [Lentinula raphanica]
MPHPSLHEKYRRAYIFCMLMRQSLRLALETGPRDSGSGSSSDSSSATSSTSSSSLSFSSDSLKDMMADLTQLQIDLAMLEAIRTTHYLHVRTIVVKCTQLGLLSAFAADPSLHSCFMDMVCVSPFIFSALLELIENHPIFSNNSSNPQAPVEVQLAVTLYRMGRNGNGNSIMDIAQICRISEGSVENFTS